jgi:hypothetical protein
MHPVFFTKLFYDNLATMQGYKFVRKLFQPKWSFVKSIPVAELDRVAVVVDGRGHRFCKSQKGVALALYIPAQIYILKEYFPC